MKRKDFKETDKIVRELLSQAKPDEIFSKNAILNQLKKRHNRTYAQ